MTVEDLQKIMTDYQIETEKKFGKLHTIIENINTRLNAQEKLTETIENMNKTIGTLAVNMEHMVQEQARQGKRLETLESKPRKHWDTIITAIITSAVGLLIGLIFTKLAG